MTSLDRAVYTGVYGRADRKRPRALERKGRGPATAAGGLRARLMAPTTQEQTIHLNEQANPEGRVLITTLDEDRFFLPCAQAVEACKMHMSRKLWFDELDAMFVRVQKWATEHREQVHAAYAAPREGHVVIFIVPKSASFDLDLGAKATDLDIELAQQYPMIPSEVMQVPGQTPQQLSTFVKPGSAKTLYG
jgi:hypothetical protein